MKELLNVRTGQKFRELSTGRVFTLLSKEGNMAEVIHQDRKWAWPVQAKVQPLN
jgi:hypothetical protein